MQQHNAKWGLKRHGKSCHVAAFRARPTSTVVLCAIKARSEKNVCCAKTLIAKPGHEKALEKLVAEVAGFSLSQAKTRSHGIVLYEVVRDAWEPNTFHTWERYESNAAMGKHNTSPQCQNFMKQVQPHLEKPVAMALYEYNNGHIGPACMSEGPKGEGGLDDATGASGAAGGASLKQTSTSFNLSETEEPDKSLLADSLQAAKKQMEGLKGIFGNIFGNKKEKENTTAGRK